MLGKFVVEKMTTNMTNGKCLCILLYFVSLTLAVEDTTVWTDKKVSVLLINNGNDVC